MLDDDPLNEQLYAAIRAGNVLAEKYRVERTLGVGGFGIVLAATHIHLDEKVAIKLLLPRAAANREATARFIREAKAAVRIRSEHVARVTDVGTIALGLPYIVMEYLDGQDLSALVKSAGPQSIADVTEWVLQAAEALAEAHALGIVHRDLKPANLFLTRRLDGTPNIKVLDFGISKIEPIGADDKGMTKTTDVMGSPYYMSPEQMKSSRNVDVRADIWALGTIVFELLAGVPPFDGETMPALLATILQEPPRELSNYRSDVPPALWAAVQRCLEKDPNARFANIYEMALAIAPFGPPTCQASIGRIAAALNQNGPVTNATPIPSVSTPLPVPGLVTANAASWAGTVSPTGSGSRAPKSKATLFAGLGLFAFAAISAGAAVAWRFAPDGSPASSATSEVNDTSDVGSNDNIGGNDNVRDNEPSEDDGPLTQEPLPPAPPPGSPEATTDPTTTDPPPKKPVAGQPATGPNVKVGSSHQAPTPTNIDAAIPASPVSPKRPLSATGTQPAVPAEPPPKSSGDMFGSQQ